jgi:hypothetical protein
MALDPKLLVGGAILGFFLLKKPSTSNAASSSDKNKNEESKGDLNDPAGPNGCKTGLKEVNGICVDDPDLDEEGNPVKNGGSGNGNGKLASSDLYISKDCKSFAFGDKTGDSWWKIKGEKTAKQWIKSGETSPYVIAFEMLKKTGSCFKLFPVRDDFKNWFEYNVALLEWISKNTAPWTLLVLIKNKIDLTQFNGMETVTADPNKANYGLVFGKQFNEEEFFSEIKPLILTMLQLEAGTPGILIGDKAYANTSDILTNIATYMFWLLMPNIPFTDLIVKYKKGMLSSIPLWKKLVDFTGEFEGQSIDLEDEQF